MYGELPTERIDPDGPELDLLSPVELARLLLREEERARIAVERALDAIGRAAALATDALRSGGRLIHLGAGTSGRLGVLDASEMGPTFGAPPGKVVARIAGGTPALTKSVEGAEDDAAAGRRAVEALGPGPRDCVVGITMSGTAAWVAGGLEGAGEAGAATVLLTANPRSRIAARERIVLDLGPEALAGSTRLKGGSATKAVLNILSTAAMAGSGAVYGNLMVAVRPANRKLRDRAERLVMRLCSLAREPAARLLREAGDDVRVAALMHRFGLGRAAARARLDACGGSLREAFGP